MIQTANVETSPKPLDESPAGRWVRHFQENQDHAAPIAWHSHQRMSAATRKRIGRSIAEFQRGESSEGRQYLGKSKAFSLAVGDPAFHTASILFVREENGHAALLLRFMQQVGIAPRPRVFSDGVFRGLRRFGDLGWASRVLMVAELIAQEYYPCLHDSSTHPVLRQICRKVVNDEEAHIRFQIERIERLESVRSGAIVAVRDVAQGVMMLGAAVVVYVGHRSVMRSR